ncbi:hypothetical protein PAMP_014819 [Pampus punctatissimus]
MNIQLCDMSRVCQGSEELRGASSGKCLVTPKRHQGDVEITVNALQATVQIQALMVENISPADDSESKTLFAAL